MATTKNQQSEKDAKAAERDSAKDARQDAKAAEKDERQTTKQAEKAQQEVPTEPTEAEDQVEVDEDTAEAVENTETSVGTTSERDVDGVEYDTPYHYLTTEDIARTSDSDDPARSWVAQENSEREEKVALTEVHGTPGQTFRARELPDRKVVEAAGIDYAQFVAGLPVRPDVPNEAARRGIPA